MQYISQRQGNLQPKRPFSALSSSSRQLGGQSL